MHNCGNTFVENRALYMVWSSDR